MENSMETQNSEEFNRRGAGMLNDQETQLQSIVEECRLFVDSKIIFPEGQPDYSLPNSVTGILLHDEKDTYSGEIRVEENPTSGVVRTVKHVVFLKNYSGDTQPHIILEEQFGNVEGHKSLIITKINTNPEELEKVFKDIKEYFKSNDDKAHDASVQQILNRSKE